MKFKVKEVHVGGSIYLNKHSLTVKNPEKLTQKEIAVLINLGYADLFEAVEPKKRKKAEPNDTDSESTI